LSSWHWLHQGDKVPSHIAAPLPHSLWLECGNLLPLMMGSCRVPCLRVCSTCLAAPKLCLISAPDGLRTNDLNTLNGYVSMAPPSRSIELKREALKTNYHHQPGKVDTSKTLVPSRLGYQANPPTLAPRTPIKLATKARRSHWFQINPVPLVTCYPLHLADYCSKLTRTHGHQATAPGCCPWLIGSRGAKGSIIHVAAIPLNTWRHFPKRHFPPC
jgi:hypothetical protein